MLETKVEVEIVEFEGKFSKDFARLNYEWIENYFAIEAHDREMLDNPSEYIINRGGQIFMAIIGNQAVGTVALINTDKKSFELAKMAVSPNFQGLRIGEKLMTACIKFSVKVSKQRIFLLSNTKLIPAIGLYRKFAFREIPLDSETPYKRTDIQMELRLEYN